MRAAAVATAVSAGLGSAPALAVLPGAIAAAPSVVDVPCRTAALLAAVARAPAQSILRLAPQCTYTLVRGLEINDALVFQGPATLARSPASGTPRFSIITVGAGADVVTENVNFTGAHAGDGGAIHNKGQLWVNFGQFSGNSAQAYGGAIYNDGELTVNFSDFTGNFARNGGAIANFGRADITGGKFTGNWARYGGALANRHEVWLSQDSFDSNGSYRTYKGGAVYNDATATLSDSTLSDNHGKAGGGFYNDATATLTGDTIRGNSTAGDGGGIYNYDQLTVSDTRIQGNQAGLDGGGLLNGGFATILSSQIYLNSAGIGGGGIHDYYMLTLTNTRLSGNRPDNCKSRRGTRGCLR